MSPDPIADLRMRLRQAGYSPLPLVGKRPVCEGWQNQTDVTDHEIDLWARAHPAATNTGVLTRLVPTLDIDILDEEAARAVEELIHSHFDDLGCVLPRVGQAPKRCYPFRTDDPFAKILINLVTPNGGEERIEFLGDGQQFVVHGIHPDTRRPYQWPKGDLIQFARGEPSVRHLPRRGAAARRRDRAPSRRTLRLSREGGSLARQRGGWRRRRPSVGPQSHRPRRACPLRDEAPFASGMGDAAVVAFLRAQVRSLQGVGRGAPAAAGLGRDPPAWSSRRGQEARSRGGGDEDHNDPRVEEPGAGGGEGGRRRRPADPERREVPRFRARTSALLRHAPLLDSEPPRRRARSRRCAPHRDGRVEVRVTEPAGMHTLSAEGANAEEGEGDRLPPPELVTLAPLDQCGLALMIEGYVTFYRRAKLKDGSAVEIPKRLPDAFVAHYLKHRRSRLPRVATLATMPVVLPNGRLLAENGLDRARRTVFRIAPGVLELMFSRPRSPATRRPPRRSTF